MVHNFPGLAIYIPWNPIQRHQMPVQSIQIKHIVLQQTTFIPLKLQLTTHIFRWPLPKSSHRSWRSSCAEVFTGLGDQIGIKTQHLGAWVPQLLGICCWKAGFVECLCFLRAKLVDKWVNWASRLDDRPIELINGVFTETNYHNWAAPFCWVKPEAKRTGLHQQNKIKQGDRRD